MRKGQNPAKSVNHVAKPERITVALLNYIPFLSGFYTEALDVLKVSLTDAQRCRPAVRLCWSLTTAPATKCVIFWQKKKQPGGYNICCYPRRISARAEPGTSSWQVPPGEIIAYTDSDVLSPQLAHPFGGNPGNLPQCRHGNRSLPHAASSTAQPYDWARKECRSRRRSIHPVGNLPGTQSLAWTDRRRKQESISRELKLENNLQYVVAPPKYGAVANREAATTISQSEETASQQTLAATSNEIVAIAGASHWQFTAYKSTLQQFLPFDMARPWGKSASSTSA